MYRKRDLPMIWMVFMVLVGLCMVGQADEKGMRVRFSLTSDPVTVTISGVVLDKATGEPIAEALVRGHVLVQLYRGPDFFERCPQGQVLTDEQGRYKLQIQTLLTTAGRGRGQDGMCVYASASGYETAPQYIRPNVTSDKADFQCDFALGKGRRLSGTVVDPEGKPVAGALVRVQNGLNGDWNFFGALGQATSNEQGEFELWMASGPTNDVTRSPWLTILKRGQGAMFIWDLFQKGDLGALTLPACGAVAGHVVDGQGEPLSGCEVSARGFPCGLIDKTQTDDQGQYILRGIPGEPSIVEFYTRKNGRFIDQWGVVEVHARLNPEIELKNGANYKLRARDSETVEAENLVMNVNSRVTGKLLSSGSSLGLGGLLVRLDSSWDNMVEVDIEGHFSFPYVAPGKHKLTAYFPHNLRYDRGIGRTTIEVTPGEPMTDVEIQLDELAELRVQYLDVKGNPLPGVTASATWSKDGHGPWTQGTVSDAEGWAVLYLYPGDIQYLGGFDPSGRLVSEMRAKIKPSPAQIMEPKQVMMVESATLTGQLFDDQNKPLVHTRLICRLAYADGTQIERPIATDEQGDFTLPHIVPGVVEISLESESTLHKNILGKTIEIEPGQALGLGGISLASGVNKAAAIEAFFEQAVTDPTELRNVTRRLLEAVQSADYTKPENWKEFIAPEYCVYTNYPAWVQWVCTNLKVNPIEVIELGHVTRSQSKGFWKDHENIPAIDYKLTLKDGTVIKGVLLFDYNLEKEYWMGMHGLDWHLNDPLK